ncbi:MAG: S8 family serine peptidase [Phycisphaerae bacterium]|nr:S8 family serine peptidase [Phycisphaerae bacterium]
MSTRMMKFVVVVFVAACVCLVTGERTHAVAGKEAVFAGQTLGNLEPGLADVNGPQSEGVLDGFKCPQYKPGEIIVKFKRAAVDTLEQQRTQKVSAEGLSLSVSIDQLNRKYKAKSIEPIFKNFKARSEQVKNFRKKNMNSLSNQEKRLLKRRQRAPKGAKVPELDRIYKITLEPGQSAEQAVADYSKDPAVEYAELNYIFSICVTEPDDTRYPEQWALNNTGQTGGTTDADIDAPEAWDITTGSSDVIIAVVDTGVDYDHLDLQGNMWGNINEIPDNNQDDDENGYIDDIYGYDFFYDDNDPMDDNGHGTHCSGTIAANGNNGIDVAGVCWTAKIMAIKSFDWSGTRATIDSLTGGIYYATNNGADIISNSWGGNGFSITMQEAFDYAFSEGVFLVAAAGNNNGSWPSFPAYFDSVMSVASTDHNDDKASSSNYGDWIDVAAPGVNILSLTKSGSTAVMSGTSMACPHVAGLAALCLSENSDLNLLDLWMLIKSGADDIGDAGWDQYFGAGRINAYNTVNYISDMPEPDKATDPYPAGSSTNISINVHLSWKSNLASTHLVYLGTDFDDVSNANTSSDEFKAEVWPAEFDPDTLLANTTYYWRIDEKNPSATTKGDVWSFTTGVGGTIHVDLDATGDDDGSSWEDAFTDLQSAIGKAFEGDEIWVAEGVYKPTNSNDRDISFTVREDITIRGGFAGTETDANQRDLNLGVNITTLSGDIGTADDINDNSYHILTVIGDYVGSSLIERFTITGGNASLTPPISEAYGGGLLVYSVSTAIFENCIFTENNAERYGGAVFSFDNESTVFNNCDFISNDSNYRGGAVTVVLAMWPGLSSLTNCTFQYNSSTNYPGGTIYLQSCYPVSFIDCNFIDNASTIFSEGSWLVLTGCKFSNPTTSPPSPGSSGVYSNSCMVTATGCRFENNSGAPLFLISSAHSISNCIFANNYSDGIWLYGTPGTIEGCIFADNMGTGIKYDNLSPLEVSVRNCLFYGNNNSQSGGAINNYGTAPEIINCTFADNNSSAYGGAIYNSSALSSTPPASPEIVNCLFWGNTASVDGDQIYNNGISGGVAEPSISYSNIQDSGGSGDWDTDLGTDLGGNIDADPCFVDADSNDFHIALNSPCIDGGDPNGDYDGQTDMDDEPRISGVRVDIGVDEVPRVHNVTDDEWYVRIQDAIDEASNGDEIVVYPGTYYESLLLGGRMTSLNCIVRSIDPDDWDVVAATVIDGDGDGNTVTLSNSLYGKFEGFTVTGGSHGAFVRYGTNMDLSKCIIEGNAEIGVKVYGCAGDISNCIIKNNGDEGISIENARPVVKNSVIYGHDSGVMIYEDSIATIHNCTIVDNNSYGIAKSSQYSNSSAAILNCILWRNGDDLYMCGGAYNCVEDGDGGLGNISSDPCFVPGDELYHIGINSPCINKGNPDGNYAGQIDIDNELRVFGTYVDMGADEADYPDAHWWNLNETSGVTAYDCVGDDDGTFNGDDPCWNNGVVDFNGVYDYFSVPTLDTAYYFGDTFSVAGWFKTSQSTGMQTIVGSWGSYMPVSNVTMYFGWQVLVEDNKVVARFGAASYTGSDITGTQDVVDPNWHHFALVYPTSSSNAVLYVDGVQDGTPSQENFYPSSNTKFRIGDGSYVYASYGGTPALKGGPFNGTIDDVMIFDRELSAEEVLQLYQRGQ